MISRVADSCFWLTRYLERVDTWSRLLDVTSSFSLDAGLSGAERWRPLIFIVGQEEDFVERIGEDSFGDGDAVQAYMVWDKENPYSLYCSYARRPGERADHPRGDERRDVGSRQRVVAVAQQPVGQAPLRSRTRRLLPAALLAVHDVPRHLLQHDAGTRTRSPS